MRDAEQQKYSEIAALVSVTVGRVQFGNAEPRFYTAWVKNGSGPAFAACPFYPQEQTSPGYTLRSGSCHKQKSAKSHILILKPKIEDRLAAASPYSPSPFGISSASSHMTLIASKSSLLFSKFR